MDETGITSEFVDRIQAVTLATIPQQAIEVAKQVVVDTLGVALAGVTRAPDLAAIAIQYVRDQGGVPQASIISGGFKTSMQHAAFVNAMLANVLEYDAAWTPPNHPASPTVPALFAIAEHLHLSGADVLEAVVIAFEVQARIRLADTGISGAMAGTGGFLKPGTTGLFGAAAGAARLLKLDKRQTAMALGLAGSRAGGISTNAGTMSKSSHAGHAARMGIECAVLAKMGWTATTDIFGPAGYFSIFANASKPELLLEGFAAPFRMVHPGVGFKAYPCIYLIHRAIDAALALRHEFEIRGEQIDSVQITQPPLHSVDRPAPKSSLDAKHSTQYSTLVALLDGAVTLDSFSQERLQAADVSALLPRVEYQSDAAIPASLEDMFATVTVKLKSGKQMSKRVDKLAGGPGNPLTREQQRTKFLSCAQPLLAKGDAQRMLELADRIETLGDVGVIMDIARCDGR